MSGHEKRTYRIDEANAQVARLSELFENVMQVRSLLKTLYQRLESAGYPVSQDELDDSEIELPDDAPAEVVRDHGMFQALVETLRDHVEKIQETGCVIKDLEEGLVDWPGLHDGREVWLCWKYGETEVGFWHELSTGFAGRRPVSELREPAPEIHEEPDTSSRSSSKTAG